MLRRAILRCLSGMLLPALLPAVALCQKRVTVEFSPPDPVKQKWIGPLPGQLRTLKFVKWDSRQDEYVAPVVQAARAVYADFFRCSLSESVQTALIPVDSERILAARWRANCGGAISEVLLWDDPLVTTYFFKMPKQFMHESVLLASTVEDLLVWQGEPWPKFDSIHFSIYRGPSATTPIGYGYPKIGVFPSELNRGLAAATWLQEDSTATWFSVTLGKLYLKHYPRDMILIAQRFPPLAMRAKNWRTEQLVQELPKEAPLAPFGQAIRNEVLLHELFTRDVDEHIFGSLMEMPRIDQGQVLQIALDAGRGSRYRGVLAGLVRTLSREPTRRWYYQRQSGIDAFLWYMKRAADVDLTPEVLEEARSGHLDLAQAFYLSERIESQEDAREFLQLIKQNLNGDSSRDSILQNEGRQVCARMALLDCGTLVTPPQPKKP